METPGPTSPPHAAAARPSVPRASPRPLFRAPFSRGASLFLRAPENPILAPTTRWWESVAVFNPGVSEGEDGAIHLLYRAVGRDGISRLGYARTRDGVTIDERLPEPILEPELGNADEQFGVEDPRITRLNGTYYILYTAASKYDVQDPHAALVPSAKSPWRVRVSLTLTTDFRTFTRRGVLLPEMDNKDVVLFPERIEGKYVLLHRLPPDIWIATSPDLRDWEEHRAVLRTRPGHWDEKKIGAGAPPLRIPEGWLLLYHGFDHHHVYRAGFALLDAGDPSTVLARSDKPALEPQEPYELRGDIPNVVFPTGLIRRGDTLLLYYGAADKVVGVARGSLKSVIASLRA